MFWCGHASENAYTRPCARASPRSERVSVYAFSSSTPVWWSGIASRLTRAGNLDIWRLRPEQSEALAGLAQRTMQLQVTVQDGTVWIADGERSVEITPQRLDGGA